MNEVAMKMSQDMQEVGLTQKQAIAIANSIAEAILKSREGLATKEGVCTEAAEVCAKIADVRAEIADLKAYIAKGFDRMTIVMGAFYLGSITILGMILS